MRLVSKVDWCLVAICVPHSQVCRIQNEASVQNRPGAYQTAWPFSVLIHKYVG